MFIRIFFSFFLITTSLQVISSELQLNDLLHRLESINRPPRFCGPSDQPECSYGEFCQTITNSTNGPYIYKSDAGEVIDPNYRRRHLSILSCATMPGGELAADDELDARLNSESEEFRNKVRSFINNQALDFFDNMPESQEAISEIELQNFLRKGLKKSTFSSQEQTTMQELVPLLTARVNRLRSESNTPPTIQWSRIPEPHRSLYQNPFYNPQVLRMQDEVGERARSLYQTKTNQVSAQFRTMIQRTVARLEQTRNSTNSSSIDNLVARVSTLRFNSSYEDEGFLESCETGNAFYEPTTHSVTICPDMMNLPEQGLSFVIGHEIAHSIDPCNCTLHLHSTDSGHELRAGSSNSALSSALQNNKFPYREQLFCFESSESAGAKRATVSSVIEKNDYSIDGFVPQVLRDRAAQIATDAPFCYNSSHPEVFSDWFSLESLALTPEQFGDSYTDFLSIFGSSCETLRSRVDDLREIRTFQESVGCHYSSAPATSSKAHNTYEMSARINNLLTAHPKARKAWNCSETREAPRYCEEGAAQ